MRKEISPIYSYIESVMTPESQPKLEARKKSEELGLEAISISQTEAHLIQFMARLVSPRKIVEIGTLTGLSALYFLELLPVGGKLWTLEKAPEHIEKSKITLNRHITSGQCEIIEGDARENLLRVAEQGPFDVVFIDGNKAAYFDYWKWAEKNVSPKGMIIIDNVFLAGAVWGDQSQQKFSAKQIATVQMMTKEIFSSQEFTASFIPTNEGLLILNKK